MGNKFGNYIKNFIIGICMCIYALLYSIPIMLGVIVVLGIVLGFLLPENADYSWLVVIIYVPVFIYSLITILKLERADEESRRLQAQQPATDWAAWLDYQWQRTQNTTPAPYVPVTPPGGTPFNNYRNDVWQQNTAPAPMAAGDMFTLGALALLGGAPEPQKRHRERRVIDEIHRDNRDDFCDFYCDDIDDSCREDH